MQLLKLQLVRNIFNVTCQKWISHLLVLWSLQPCNHDVNSRSWVTIYIASSCELKHHHVKPNPVYKSDPLIHVPIQALIPFSVHDNASIYMLWVQKYHVMWWMHVWQTTWRFKFISQTKGGAKNVKWLTLDILSTIQQYICIRHAKEDWLYIDCGQQNITPGNHKVHNLQVVYMPTSYLVHSWNSMHNIINMTV